MKRANEINVLIACEESQRSCMAFRERGFNAYSNDIIKCSGHFPKYHILENALNILDGGACRLQNGKKIDIDHWDLIIAHPPCTYLSGAATSCHSLKVTPENRIIGRTFERINAMEFFMKCFTANAKYIAVENPVGVMNTAFRKPDQIIEPYYFAESETDSENYVTKRTCLWLKNLPQLIKTNDLPKPDNATLFGTLKSGKRKGKALNFVDANKNVKIRSKTFPGVANAFAEQWGEYLLKELN